MKIVNIDNSGRTIYLFCRKDNGELEIIEKNDFFPYFYDIHPEGEFKSFDGNRLKKMFVSIPSDVPTKRRKDSYEADILFVKRYLIDKVDKLEKCSIKYAFIDIEVLADELPNVEEAKNTISCISIYNSLYKTIQSFYLGNYKTEYELIEDFIKYMQKEKFDLWLSWNVNFDYNYLYNRIPDFAKRISPIEQTRYGNKDIYYPAGISIVDYLGWFKKVTLNRAKSYALDNVAQEYLKEETYNKIDFSKLSRDILEKNINDIKRMIKLEQKFQIVDYFDEIRRLSKVEWEDMLWNSRVIDMLLLQEAKNQNIILPMKPTEDRGTLTEKEEYEGAFREAYELGAHFGITEYDLSSAYPFAIIDFCLDPSNIIYTNIHSDSDEPYLPEHIQIENTLFEQNPNALLPTITKKLIELKKQYKGQGKKYDAIKTVVNSAYGVFGNRFFRLYDKRVASATTYLVRDLLKYVKEKIESKGYKVIYIDTDSVFINTEENLTNILNEIVQEWANKKGKDKVNIEFEYKGLFERLLILAKCLDGRSKILTEEGYKTIQWIHTNKYRGNVVSLGKFSQLEYKPIINSFKIPLQHRKLYKVVLEENINNSRNYGAILTEDHRILTEEGYKELKYLSKKDKIHTGYYQPIGDIYEMLLGTLLGDSSISKNNLLSCAHSQNQKEYLEFKANLLGYKNKIKKQAINDKYISYRFTSNSEYYLKKLRKKLYNKKGKKIITKDLLKDYSYISLAFHFLDDGYLRKTRYYSSELAMCGYTNKEILLLSNRIKELGINNKITKNKRIYFTVKQTKKLSWLICNYVPSCMNYKLLLEHRNLVAPYEYFNSKKPIYDTFKLISYNCKQKSVYDIEIKDNSNFMTLSGIVHNCRYVGYARTKKGIEKKVKGVEMKRKDSTIFMKKFQEDLIEQILNKYEKDNIMGWIENQKTMIKYMPLEDIAFPCKLSRKVEEYKNTPIFVRALEYSNLNKKVGDTFYYIYVKANDIDVSVTTEIYDDKELLEKREGNISKKEIEEEYKENNIELSKLRVLHKKTKKAHDVMAFDEDHKDHVKNINWDLMIQRNIDNKKDVIFEAMGWKE